MPLHHFVLFDSATFQALKHPHVIKVVGSEKKNQGMHTEFYIVMEFADKSLMAMMQERHAENRRFSEKEVLRIFNDVVAAVAHLHSQSPPVAHRDLKIENVLLGTDRLFKLCDFGSCIRSAYEPVNMRDCNKAEEEIERNTTLCYRAPEMCDLLSKQRIDEKCDIWALGCLLFYLCFFELPFEEQKLQIISGKYQIPQRHSFQAEVIGLIRLCLTLSPHDRPDIWIVAEHVAKIRGIENTIVRPADVPVQPVSIGGHTASSAQKPAATAPAQRKTVSRSPPPDRFAAPAAPAAGGALFSQLDWHSSDGSAVAATSPHSPAAGHLTPTAAKKSDFNMPLFDDLAISPPANSPPADPFAASPPPQNSNAFDDFNPRELGSSFDIGAGAAAGTMAQSSQPASLWSTQSNQGSDVGSLFSAPSITPSSNMGSFFESNSDDFNPRQSEAVKSTTLLPAGGMAGGDALFSSGSNDPFANDLFSGTPVTTTTSTASSDLFTNTPSTVSTDSANKVEDKASDFLAGFMASSSGKPEAKPAPTSTRPAYTSMKSKSGASPLTGSPQPFSSPTSDPFASLF